MNREHTDLSIVIPIWNEEPVFGILTERLEALLTRLPPRTEVLLVDDGSTDASGVRIREVCAANPRFKGILFSRNFGQQAAISAGLHYARGEAVAVMDADLQDAPELLVEFCEKLRQGYDVVYAVRQHRKESWLKRCAYALFYRLLRAIAAVPIPLDSGDFCLMSRRVVNLIKSMPERHRFIRGMRAWIGFSQCAFPCPRDAREHGRSKYTLLRLARLALDGICAFSVAPLRLATCLGFLTALAAMGWGAYIVVWRLLTNQPIPGFATLAAGICFLGGVQLITIGILGEYVGRIYTEIKQRPLFVVDQLIGIGDSSD